MATDPFQIPSRVIFNWDFKKYPVSQKAAAFLQEFQHQSFIDLKILNPEIYQYVDEMAELQSLRIQLNFIRAYLFTCCAPIIEKLRKQLWTKEYLYEHIHRYTFADLQRIPKRVLADQLRKVVGFGRQHILECPLCSQKGFICEICQSNKVLYPFDIDTTYKVSYGILHCSLLHSLNKFVCIFFSHCFYSVMNAVPYSMLSALARYILAQSVSVGEKERIYHCLM